jgi:hypothetical protein
MLEIRGGLPNPAEKQVNSREFVKWISSSISIERQKKRGLVVKFNIILNEVNAFWSIVRES